MGQVRGAYAPPPVGDIRVQETEGSHPVVTAFALSGCRMVSGLAATASSQVQMSVCYECSS